MNMIKEEMTYSEFSSAKSGLYIVHKNDQRIRLSLTNEDIKGLSEMPYKEWKPFHLGKY
jgi:hypothetical protein